MNILKYKFNNIMKIVMKKMLNVKDVNNKWNKKL